MIEGIQEKIISKEIFLKVNGLLSQNHFGYTVKPENDCIPLKRFLKCEDCGSYLRAYKASKNQKYYYKCNTIGCKCNKRADDLHEAVKVMLEQYTVDINEDYRQLIRTQAIITYNQLNKDKDDLKAKLDKDLSEVEKKIERLEERYVLEEIDSSMFQKFKAKFYAERVEISKHLAKNGKQVSNLEGCIDYAITMSSKLASMWDSSDYGDKQVLQNLVFPEGMTYNRKNDQCRTPRVNSIFRYIAGLASISEHEKSGNNTRKSDVSALVEEGRSRTDHLLYAITFLLFKTTN